jgi:hypothetical protein
MGILAGERFIIWGLRNSRHSHRYIHKGYFETLRRLNVEALWLDDLEKNRESIRSGDFVLAAGVACNYLPISHKVKYVLHNVDNPNFQEVAKKLNLQVFTTDSRGEKIDETIALWDQKEKTLYQPWGLPEPREDWLTPQRSKSKKENWIGAIWDNELHQGNREQLAIYAATLKIHGIRFKRLGGTRSISIEGLSSRNSFDKVNQSAIGAAVVGEWQKKSGYIPCRAFKNIAAGAIPISNANMTHVFGSDYIHISDLEELVEYSLGLDLRQIRIKSESCKKMLEGYSYESALNRIVSLSL